MNRLLNRFTGWIAQGLGLGALVTAANYVPDLLMLFAR
ncbi:hypothetical protein SF06_22380 [Pseudomonas flexibilis]|uniref:Uncharacterized protein n=1 Tax=Pseudomonas flexibilis TaxID=706570 RepID=A0A1N6UFI5_9PSED|nr:hypothetical protein SF06_22380 [Pseudomonas flexibilis]SIQ64359.1 hypothetical protein SAMN05421672_108131 [Pseudomonas flexibilis]